MEHFEVFKDGSDVYLINAAFSEELPLKKFRKYITLSYARDAELSITGRGAVRYIMLASGRKVVVRKGLRGGFIARFNEDTYFQKPAAHYLQARQVRELQVLDFLLSHEVSVARPVAAFIRYLPWRLAYRGYLATEDIGGHNLLHLGSSVAVSEMGEDAFIKYCRLAGKEARKMLEAGVYHPDLHLGNVLYTTTDKIYLIDFDNAIYLKDGLSRDDAEKRILSRWTRGCGKHFLEEIAVEPFKEGLLGE